MSSEAVILIVQVIAAFGVVVSVVYLGVQIRQQNEITKAQFGHHLTERLYERYFESSKDAEFASFLASDWSDEQLDTTESYRIMHFIMMCLVDVFDTYEKVESGMVEEKHLNIRMRNLKLSIMKTGLGKLVWQHWKQNQTTEFVEWFEAEIYGGTPDNIEYDAERSKTFNLRRD
mgnify:CR=1 FL=1